MPTQWTACSELWQRTLLEENDMSIFQSLIKKEALHIVRDKRTMIITLVMPLVLLLLFGFAISMEVNEVRVAAVIDRHTQETREIVEKLQANEYFTFIGDINESEVDNVLRKGEADAVLFLRTESGKLSSHIVVDASNPIIGQSSSAYIQSVLAGNQETPVLTETLYNPQLKSAYNFVPGIMGMIFILICAIMTSVSIVSEKETGTMDLLLVSPVKPGVIIFGKLIPYFLLSCIILTVMLLLAYTVLGLPVSYTIVNVVFISLLYIALSLSIGLLVSTLVNNQVSALIVSAVLFMLPVIMLSGMIFPIDNMPQFFRWVSCAIPARWYISAMKKLMIQQLDFTYIMDEFLILLGMTGLLLLLAIKKFNKG